MTNHFTPGRPTPCRTKALLLAAGVGTRLRPLTEKTPKCLVRVAGRPLLAYWFDRLAEAGVTDVLINTHHLADQVRGYIDGLASKGLFTIRETYEPELLGSAGTIHANRAWMDDADECLIIYADNISNVDLGRMIRFQRSHDDPMTILLFHAPDPRQCGIVEMDEQGKVMSFVEKPKNPTGNLANAGLYAVTARAYREIAAMDCFDLGFDVLPAFAGRMRGWVFDGYHRDIGTLEALRQAEHDVRTIFRQPRRVQA